MTSQFLRDALLELLFRHMADHIDRGLDYDEALILGVEEIKWQIRGSRLDLQTTMIDHAVREVRQSNGKLH